MEEACRERRCQLGVHALSASRLAEYRHPTRVAAKLLYVPMNPLECELLVHQSVVAIEMAFGIYRGLSEKSQVTQTVVNCDDDDALFHERRRIISIRAPKLESATMNPNHNGPMT